MHVKRRQFLSGSLTASLLAAIGCGKKRGEESAAPSEGASTAGDDAGAGGRGEGEGLLILGGTGFLGPHVVEAALASGLKVTLFNRGKTNPHLFPDVEKLRGDRDGGLDELAAAVAAGRRWRAVIDTSGYVPRIVGDSAALLADAVEQYVFISSISVYAEMTRVGLDEAAAVATLEDPSVEEVTGETYGALKALCEQAAERRLPGRTTNVRPGLIVGPGDPTDRYTYWPARAARGGAMVAPGRPRDPVQYIDVRDLASWLLVCVRAGHRGIYNATGPASGTTIGELVGTCVEVGGAGAEPVWIDAEFLAAREVMPWMNMPVWVPPESEEGGISQVSIAKAVAAGLTFRGGRETAADTLAWWRELPEERRAKPRAGLDPVKEAEVLAAWAERPADDRAAIRRSRGRRLAAFEPRFAGRLA
ncbi:MAG: NAD-dependent epimerase/dehydratase family protein [Nannocystaceae bacterium]